MKEGVRHSGWEGIQPVEALKVLNRGRVIEGAGVFRTSRLVARIDADASLFFFFFFFFFLGAQ